MAVDDVALLLADTDGASDVALSASASRQAYSTIRPREPEASSVT